MDDRVNSGYYSGEEEEEEEDIFLKRWGKGVNKPIIDEIRENKGDYYQVDPSESTYTINFTPKGRVFSLLFEYLDYIHDSKLRKGIDENIKAYLPWVHGDHQTNFIEFLGVHNTDYVEILGNMIEGDQNIDKIFQVVYSFYINLGETYNIGARGIKKVGEETINKYGLDKSKLQGSNQEKAFKYLLLQILKKKEALKIIPITDYLDRSKFNTPIKNNTYCIFDQSTTCYGIKNILPRFESPTQYLDEGIGMSKGKIVDQIGLSLSLKSFLAAGALHDDKLIEELDTFTSQILNSYTAEVLYQAYEDEKKKLMNDYFQKNHTSITLRKLKNQKHFVQNGNVNINVTVDGVVEYSCSYGTDDKFYIGYNNEENVFVTLEDLINSFKNVIKNHSVVYRGLSGKKKKTIDKLLNNPSKIFSAAESAQLCAIINTIDSRYIEQERKNMLLGYIYKSKFLGDYGPVVQSCVQGDGTLYLVHQTGDSSAQNQGIVLYLLSRLDEATADYSSNDTEPINAKIGLRMCSDSGFINLSDDQQLISLNGIAMYLGIDDIEYLDESLTGLTGQTGNGKKVYKKVKSKKNKRKSSKKIKKTKKKPKSQNGGNIEEYEVSHVELFKLPEDTIVNYMKIIGNLEDNQIIALGRDLFGQDMRYEDLIASISDLLIPQGVARSASSGRAVGANNRQQFPQLQQFPQPQYLS